MDFKGAFTLLIFSTSYDCGNGRGSGDDLFMYIRMDGDTGMFPSGHKSGAVRVESPRGVEYVLGRLDGDLLGMGLESSYGHSEGVLLGSHGGGEH